LEEATEKTVDTGAGPVHFRELGEGEPLVFIHGLLVNGLLWRKVVPALATRYRCVVPDLPLGAHRTPMAKDADLSPPGLAKIIAEVADGLNLGRATFIANDTGGAITQILAASQPERFERLVLTPCDMFDNFLPPLFRPLQWIGSNPTALGAVLQPMRIEAIRNSPLGFGWLAKRAIEKRISDRYIHCVLHSSAIRRDVSKILRGISAKYTIEAAEKLRTFDAPALLVWADEDRVFPVEHGRRMAAILPDARVHMVDDSYSFVPEDQPDQLAALIADFVG